MASNSESRASDDRRAFLKKSAAGIGAAGLVWTAPSVLGTNVAAASSHDQCPEPAVSDSVIWGGASPTSVVLNQDVNTTAIRLYREYDVAQPIPLAGLPVDDLVDVGGGSLSSFNSSPIAYDSSVLICSYLLHQDGGSGNSLTLSGAVDFGLQGMTILGVVWGASGPGVNGSGKLWVTDPGGSGGMGANTTAYPPNGTNFRGVGTSGFWEGGDAASWTQQSISVEFNTSIQVDQMRIITTVAP